MLGVSAVFLAPIFIVLINSFKHKFSISQTPFILPDSETFSGFENYITGVRDTGFLTAFFWSLFVTVCSVVVIIVFTSMTAWYIVRSKGKIASLFYYLFVFSMIVPFQMVMFTMSKIANVLRLDNPLGLILLYLGFGAGLSVFMFAGFVKSVPKGIEEAATIDGCNVFEVYWRVVFQVLRPT
ncbi:MAG: carbohydrate ABC transporter permease, partial [Clostridia bacterium]|nr:carbohydrate ABC transporter permease [Clostridia bacterium]